MRSVPGEHSGRLRFKRFTQARHTARTNHTLAHPAALHQHSMGAPLSNPPLKCCPELTRQRCEAFRRARARGRGLTSSDVNVTCGVTILQPPENLVARTKYMIICSPRAPREGDLC